MTYGEVVNIGKDKRSGLYVTLRHGDFTISYCHLSQATVTKGIHVCPGMIVAITGNSGSRSTGPHLHITVKYKGRTINPAVILNRFKQAGIEKAPAILRKTDSDRGFDVR